jgi:hypothetical protein
MNALANINNLPLSKIEQADFVGDVITEILAGNMNPLEADLRFKAMQTVIEAIRKDKRVSSYTIEEAEKFGKTFMFQGCEITVTQKTTKDFSGVDTVLDDLYTQQEKLKALIKAREATVANGTDPATGETFSPPKTSTTQFLTYKFK